MTATGVAATWQRRDLAGPVPPRFSGAKRIPPRRRLRCWRRPVTSGEPRLSHSSLHLCG